jgi:hypothetical protein
MNASPLWLGDYSVGTRKMSMERTSSVCCPLQPTKGVKQYVLIL